MKIVKKLFSIFIILSIVINTLIGCKEYENEHSVEKHQSTNLIKISVFQYRADDDYIAAVSKNLEQIQSQNQGKVQFTFYDSNNSQQLQNENIAKAIQDGTDLLVVNLVDIEAGEQVINTIKENNLPVILYNREPISHDPIKSYNKCLYLGNDSREGGIIQGQILIDVWNSKKRTIDRNGDEIMQYIMLSGGINNKEASGRTIYSVKTIESAGIKTEELALRVASFDEELAKKAIEALFFRHGNNIEVIIANDDTMAIGAIKALQSLGYNKGEGSTTIPVIGFDAEEEARKLIEKGYMTGTVIQSTYLMAEAIYVIGMNLVFKRHALEGTNYAFDETGVCVRIPYQGILVNSNQILN